MCVDVCVCVHAYLWLNEDGQERERKEDVAIVREVGNRLEPDNPDGIEN